MLPVIVAEAVVAARRSDALKRAEQQRYRDLARAHAAHRARPTVPTQPRRRFRWHRRPVIRPA